jgi:hypothetical protein
MNNTKKFKIIDTENPKNDMISILDIKENLYSLGGFCAVSDREFIYLGGQIPLPYGLQRASDSSYMINHKTRQAFPIGNKNPRSLIGQCVHLNGKMFTIGGCKDGNPVQDLEIYKIKGNYWKTGPSVPSLIYSCSASVVDSSIYFTAFNSSFLFRYDDNEEQYNVAGAVNDRSYKVVISYKMNVFVLNKDKVYKFDVSNGEWISCNGKVMIPEKPLSSYVVQNEEYAYFIIDFDLANIKEALFRFRFSDMKLEKVRNIS